LAGAARRLGVLIPGYTPGDFALDSPLLIAETPYTQAYIVRRA